MKNIILVGYMGCGKTTVGESIAEATRYTFADTDEMIVAQQGRSISDIFAQDGEPAFRDMETALLVKMLTEKNDTCVISTGGGMPVQKENRNLLRQLGTVVYLRAKPETVYERIKGDTTRPLLQCENPMERIREMIKSRNPAYEEAAELVIDVDDLTQREVAEQIIRKTED
ncbi:MAG: shikimate kinase [Lachnospiraceae bacterium]|nr:shikimate kinase [Lachnospiraceae bacterium]